MTSAAVTRARAVLDDLQPGVDSRDTDRLHQLFDEPAILIGTGGDARNGDAVRGYLTAVATQDASLRWQWDEIVPFYEDAMTIGFACFGDIVVTDANGERRAPIRASLLAVET